MKSKSIFQLVFVLLPLAISAAAWADAQEGQFYLSPMASGIDTNLSKQYDSDTGGSIDFGKAISETWNAEVGLRSFSPEGIGAQDQTDLDFDFQRIFRRAQHFSPYLLFGLGLTEVELAGTAGDDRTTIYLIGAGFNADIFGSSDVALRLEYRRRFDDAFAQSGEDDIFSIGLQFPFGGQAAPAPVVNPDTDGDGVPNSLDQCPNTPRGRMVDASGCEIVLDDDGDGVPNNQDRCPNTLAGVAVDGNGCELDSDGDGVVDRLDRCPNTRAGVAVDVNGCEIRAEISLPGVNFETNSDVLRPEAVGVLEEATQTLLRNPQLVVEVVGHTDSDGAADYNLDLSNRRAVAVRQFFVNRGVPASQLTARGYGELQPIADNTTAAGKAMNRRVVLRILPKTDSPRVH